MVLTIVIYWILMHDELFLAWIIKLQFLIMKHILFFIKNEKKKKEKKMLSNNFLTFPIGILKKSGMV